MRELVMYWRRGASVSSHLLMISPSRRRVRMHASVSAGGSSTVSTTQA
jgi:hypothetical protein